MTSRDYFKVLEDEGFDVTPLAEEAKYFIGKVGDGKQIVPRQIRQDALDDYLKYFDAVTNNEKRKVKFARDVLIGDTDFVVDEKVHILYKPNREKLLEILKEDSKRPISELRKKPDHRCTLEQAVIGDLRDLVIAKKQRGQIPNTDRRLDSLELVIKKYDPSIYEKAIGLEKPPRNILVNKIIRAIRNYGLNIPSENIKENLFGMGIAVDDGRAAQFFKELSKCLVNGISLPLLIPVRSLMGFMREATFSPEDKKDLYCYKDYELQITQNPELISKAAHSTGSSCFMEYSATEFKSLLDDPGTIYFVGKENGKIRGYLRILVARNEDGQSVFSIDTIEPPGKQFKKYMGFVNALTLGAIQLAFDMGAKYVVSDDARIEYGPRKAFGNKRRNMILTKIGKMPPPTQYSAFFVNETEPYILMDNWKVEK